MTNDKEQLEFCEILDDWYLNCKHQFKGTHNLGMRKEDLKQLVCQWIEKKQFDKSDKSDKSILERIGFCKHQWFELSEKLQSEFMIRQVVKCRKCGILKSIKLW